LTKPKETSCASSIFNDKAVLLNAVVGIITINRTMVYAGFRLFAVGKKLQNSDIGCETGVSLVDCALACLLVRNCTAFDLAARRRRYICQFSKRKVSCMEREEVDAKANYRIFEKKVRIPCKKL
jgi:hypothetical protein